MAFDKEIQPGKSGFDELLNIENLILIVSKFGGSLFMKLCSIKHRISRKLISALLYFEIDGRRICGNSNKHSESH